VVWRRIWFVICVSPWPGGSDRLLPGCAAALNGRNRGVGDDPPVTVGVQRTRRMVKNNQNGKK
jgi:hypothetical protein